MIDLASTYAKHGVPFVEMDGWRTRGGFPFDPIGIVNHHTADAEHTGPGDIEDDARVAALCRDGRSDLKGPLAEDYLARTGVHWLVAAGQANHAGIGCSWVRDRVVADLAPTTTSPGHGDISGNPLFFGREWENDGIDEPWPEQQVESGVRADAAICLEMGWSANRCIEHQEWTDRKIDRSRIDPDGYRALVAEWMVRLAAPDEQEELIVKRLFRIKGEEGPWRGVWLSDDFFSQKVPKARQTLAVRRYGKIREVGPDSPAAAMLRATVPVRDLARAA